MYGSHFINETLRPRASSNVPRLAAVNPLPIDDTTPPVTKMYFCFIASLTDRVADFLEERVFFMRVTFVL